MTKTEVPGGVNAAVLSERLRVSAILEFSGRQAQPDHGD